MRKITVSTQHLSRTAEYNHFMETVVQTTDNKIMIEILNELRTGKAETLFPFLYPDTCTYHTRLFFCIHKLKNVYNPR
jgi:hypothetical protein